MGDNISSFSHDFEVFPEGSRYRASFFHEDRKGESSGKGRTPGEAILNLFRKFFNQKPAYHRMLSIHLKVSGGFHVYEADGKVFINIHSLYDKSNSRFIAENGAMDTEGTSLLDAVKNFCKKFDAVMHRLDNLDNNGWRFCLFENKVVRRK